MKTGAKDSQPRCVPLKGPDGSVVEFELADLVERFAALLFDLIGQSIVLILGFLLVCIPILVLTGWVGIFLNVMVVVFFLGAAGYFLVWEWRSGGQTWGKKKFKLRAVDRQGGRLTPSQLLARNLTRMVEVYGFLNLVAFFFPEFGESAGWLGGVASLGGLVLPGLVFVTRDRQRAGDLLAGTVVVRIPDCQLKTELAEQRSSGAPVFSREQLERYGTGELGLLEQVLRGETYCADPGLIPEVARRIQTKIGWTPPEGQPIDSEQFLRSFYRELRGHLERGRITGRQRVP